jgi:hypothetical protein
MTKARDIANAGTALATVDATELGYLDGVTSAVQTQIDSKIGQSTAINPTIVDAKGDIVAATAADTVARLAVGANDTVLTADSAEATGLKWAAPAGGATFPTFKAYKTTSNQSISSATDTKVTFNAESWDTDSCFDTSTSRFTPNIAGYYQINCTIYVDTTNDGNRNVFYFYKNGSYYETFQNNIRRGNTAGELGMGGSTIMYFNGSSDYAEVYIYTQSGSTVMQGSGTTYFTGIGIRS